LQVAGKSAASDSPATIDAAERARSEALGLLETARYPDIARLRSVLGIR
jgi:hypothetical protein